MVLFSAGTLHLDVMATMANFISHQEQVKITPRKQTLHEKMCFIADSIIRYNFSDVAVHDRRILKKMRPNEVRLWVINETGSQFVPMYCRLAQWHEPEQVIHDFSAVEITLARYMRIDAFAKRAQEVIWDHSEFYLVTKGSDRWSGSITPIEFCDLVRLVFVDTTGKLVK